MGGERGARVWQGGLRRGVASALPHVGERVEHARRDGCRVRAQDVLGRLVAAPHGAVARGAVASALMHRLHSTMGGRGGGGAVAAAALARLVMKRRSFDDGRGGEAHLHARLVVGGDRQRPRGGCGRRGGHMHDAHCSTLAEECAARAPLLLSPPLTRQEERVVHVPRRVRLRLEERVEVPERRLDEAVRRHLREAHLEEDLPELRADLRRECGVSKG